MSSNTGTTVTIGGPQARLTWIPAPTTASRLRFFSENADLARAVTDLGVTFDGPPRRRILVLVRACIEGLFFFTAFTYVYFLRSKGLLNGLADGTNWVFRDETGNISS